MIIYVSIPKALHHHAQESHAIVTQGSRKKKRVSRETGENNQDRMYQGKAINRNRSQHRPDEEGMNDAAIGALSELEIMRRGCLA